MYVKERIDDRAFGNITTTTLGGHIKKHTLHFLKVGDFLLDLFCVLQSQVMYRSTGVVTHQDQTQQAADFFDGESQFSVMSSSTQPPLEGKYV